VKSDKIIDALGKSVNTTVASVDTSMVLGEVKKEYAAARGEFEQKGKGCRGGLKRLLASET
jgi:hypothetical protein